MPIAKTVRLGESVAIPHESLVNLYGCTIGDETKLAYVVREGPSQL